MKCEEIRERMPEVAAGFSEITADENNHLATCHPCAEQLKQMRSTMNLLDEWQVPEPSPYFSARLRARMREEHASQNAGWLSWLRRPAVVTAAAALMAVGVGVLEGAHWKVSHQQTLAGNTAGATLSAVSDLQYLDNNADLFADFDALDDNQTETN